MAQSRPKALAMTRDAARDAAFWIERLALVPHPEGGYFRETYRAAESIPKDGLPARFDAPRALSTAIYFLLTADEFAALHRLRSDEVWHFYVGSPLELVTIDPEGRLAVVTLGADPERGEILQAVVPAGLWLGAALAGGGSFALVGCTVAPGFDFNDFELGKRAALLRRYPQHRVLVERLTRQR